MAIYIGFVSILKFHSDVATRLLLYLLQLVGCGGLEGGVMGWS